MTVPTSFSGSAQATTLYANVTNVATSFTVTSIPNWTETVGSHIGQPLGTSGPFVITLDYGQSTEEKVLCTGITGSGPYTITVATGGRGYDSGPGNPSAQGHSASSAYPVVHTYSADIPQQANLGVTNAATAQSTADAATTTANAALPKAGGTMTGAIAMGANKITNLAAGTTTTDATNYTQLSAVSTVANGTQLATGTGKLSGTIPSTATPLRVIGWTQSITVATASAGIGVAIPSGFTNALMSVVGTYANEGTSGVGLRVVIDTNGSATDSFKAWIYNAAGTRVATTGVFSFVAVGY
jgi:hypothetical protein